jgi:putative Holliday junction resolvase
VRILGVDFGDSRTGLSLSDPLGLTCRPLEVVAERDQEALIKGILERSRNEGVTLIVVGLPRPLGGGTNSQMARVLDFVRRLQAEASVPIATWDERFTSRLAEKGHGSSGARDAVAACYMLQNYLDAHTEITERE